MELKSVVNKLTQFAPLKLAEKWDNVGLLVEPSQPKTIERIFLTNDLTEKVMEEAIQTKASMILSYHPPIFAPLKRLTQASVKERIIVKAIEERIAIYSPHTTYDSVKGGVNDWLASGLGEGKVDIIQPFQEDKLKLVVFVPEDSAEKIRNAIAKAGAGVIGNYTHCTFAIPGTGTFKGNEDSNPTLGKKLELESVSELRIEAICDKNSVTNVVRAVIANHPYETPAYEFYKLESSDVEGTGQGRVYSQ
jgi:dinuclear metal center YbgI/SA1388 family protein